MKIYNLTSGSKGNATLVICDNFNILIDAGSTKKYLSTALETIGYNLGDIDMVLVTHFHTDHVKSLNVFSKEIIYSTRPEHKKLKLYQDNDFENILIYPFQLSHDEECLGYQIKFSGEVYTHISDTGYVKNDYHELIKNSTYLYLEFNHDLQLLNQCDRPSFVKRRILSDAGHLNNLDAAYLLCTNCDNLKELFVAHISDEANAIDEIEAAIKQVFIDFDKEINFKIKYTAFQKIVSGGIVDED